MNKKVALIAGGNGIVGRNLSRYLSGSDDWEVIVTSKTPLKYDTKAQYVSLDLSDSEAVKKQKELLKNVSHVFFAAYTERQNPYEQVEANQALIENLILGLEAIQAPLEHVVFIQGGKAYGAHLGIYKTPAKETDPRSITPNFYYNQEDFLRSESQNKNWSWTAIRPDIVIGYTIGNPMNLSNLIAVYATLCKEEGLPLRFPGSPKAYKVLVNVTGTDVLNQGLEWAATNENTKNEIFNITNGDIFRWYQAFEKIADFFDMEVAGPQTFSLQEYMPGKTALWNGIVEKYGLQKNSLNNLVQWGFGDFIFNVEYDAILDVNKARRFGFHKMQTDSIEYIINTFQTLKDKKIIP
ncbi:NAD-dependent epimerase/dehydratase family protein [Maribellus comscasis]|uniref:NAD-dependent epimerase/dehydratase family protein n=1 Tax=Maribellus comscasis TaxID=2681766 RepID=A0A6I6JN11_9BACT|nr:SDR family oxidoreductase [Maribellus comscasis]QGY42489.1 NAD-dependent epimerase/dehydratase family protein [Maribellus comscasis]